MKWRGKAKCQWLCGHATSVEMPNIELRTKYNRPKDDKRRARARESESRREMPKYEKSKFQTNLLKVVSSQLEHRKPLAHLRFDFAVSFRCRVAAEFSSLLCVPSWIAFDKLLQMWIKRNQINERMKSEEKYGKNNNQNCSPSNIVSLINHNKITLKKSRAQQYSFLLLSSILLFRFSHGVNELKTTKWNKWNETNEYINSTVSVGYNSLLFLRFSRTLCFYENELR